MSLVDEKNRRLYGFGGTSLAKADADIIYLRIGSGHLTEQELSTALVNGDWTTFDMHTVRMMMRFVSRKIHLHPSLRY